MEEAMIDHMMALDRATLTSQEVAAASGMSYRMIDYWCRTGAITPHLDARGSGTRRLWTCEQARWLVAIADTWRQAERAGLCLGVDAVRDMWDALDEGREWTVTLRVAPSVV
jgi:DNA-binding transcriptional MerR regulator